MEILEERNYIEERLEEKEHCLEWYEEKVNWFKSYTSWLNEGNDKLYWALHSWDIAFNILNDYIKFIKDTFNEDILSEDEDAREYTIKRMIEDVIEIVDGFKICDMDVKENWEYEMDDRTRNLFWANVSEALCFHGAKYIMGCRY